MWIGLNLIQVYDVSYPRDELGRSITDSVFLNEIDFSQTASNIKYNKFQNSTNSGAGIAKFAGERWNESDAWIGCFVC